MIAAGTHQTDRARGMLMQKNSSCISQSLHAKYHANNSCSEVDGEVPCSPLSISHGYSVSWTSYLRVANKTSDLSSAVDAE